MPKQTVLPPAEEIDDDAPYNLRTLKTPILRGTSLKLFALLLESPLGAIIEKPLKRKSGIPQVLSEIKIPEKPTFMPTPFFQSEQGLHEIEIVSQSDYKNLIEVLQLLPEIPLTPNRPPRIRDYHQSFLSGRKSPLDVVDKIISTLTEFPELHWFIQLNKEEIWSQGEASMKRYETNTALSVLDGVPFCVKDSLQATHHKTTCGTGHLLIDCENESPIVSTLKSLGAIFIGKTNMHEIGLGVTGLNLIHGTPVNPWDDQVSTGGSTSGGAAVVASGLCPITIGSDGGGSIRIPCSFCGTFGMKLTHGRQVEQRGMSMDYSVMTTGPITNHVEDSIIVYSLLAKKGLSAEAPVYLPGLRHPVQEMPLTGMKLGVYWEWFNDVDIEIKTQCREAVDLLMNLGMELITVVIPELELLRVAHTITIVSEMNHAMHKYYTNVKTRRLMNKDVRINLTIASKFKAREYIQAQCIRTRMGVHFKRVLELVDCIVTPTTPMTAPRFHSNARTQGESNVSLTSKLMRFTQAANFLGLPAASIAVGLDDNQRLPIGLQLIGRHWQESVLFKICHHLEQKLIQKGRTTSQTPQYFFDPLN
eukprot:g5600.t1